MKLTKTTTIDVTADEVWAVFAHRFDDVDEWTPHPRKILAMEKAGSVGLRYGTSPRVR